MAWMAMISDGYDFWCGTPSQTVGAHKSPPNSDVHQSVLDQNPHSVYSYTKN